MLRTLLALVTLLSSVLLGCDDPLRRALPLTTVPPDPPDSGAQEPPITEPSEESLRINEVVSQNDGAWVDEQGETDDFIELINRGGAPLDLGAYAIGDRPDRMTALPARKLGAGEVIVFFADGSPEQGPLHLPFKLSSQGDPLLLMHGMRVVDQVAVPALAPNESYARRPDATGAFAPCRFASPERRNGDRCEPDAPPAISDDTHFLPYTWPKPWPAPTGPLVLAELALDPAAFVEVLNAGSSSVTLADYRLALAPLAPGAALPGASDGVQLAWPSAPLALGPGERVVVPVNLSDTSALVAPAREGVVTLFASSGAVSDRVDFMRWSTGASLARVPDESGSPRYCKTPSPGAGNSTCDPVLTRDVADRVHALATAGDFAALADGGTELGESGVKFVVDMQAGDEVHLLGTRDWPLHYSFIREMIYHEPHLDRCDEAQRQAFDSGWYTFSEAEYFRVEGRRFLLGTLVSHPNGSKTVEFTSGDVISGPQMKRAFFAAVARTPDPEAYAIRPIDARQAAELRKVEGSVPVVGPNAPYVGATFQPLTAAVGYGTLRFIPASELEDAELGPNVIVVTDDVPNGVAFTGGLITEAFQTPLAHVSVLSRARNTPNMALRDARHDPQVAALLGQLVRLEVRPTDYELRAATVEEADAFFRARQPTGPALAPARDLSLRGIVPLDTRGYADAATIGSKASGIAELYRVNESSGFCGAPAFATPEHAFAIPFAHYVDHFEASGAHDLLTRLEQDPAFRTDPKTHAAGLAQLRNTILMHPVEPVLLADITGALKSRFGTARVRFRSSSNTEDLATFNGAGLHTSTSVDIDQSDSAVADGLRVVWSSLWNTRAYDERAFGHIDQSLAAMAVLVHPAFPGEAAQGVAISRNAVHATRADQYYINAQVGEASVTNPAPSVTSDAIVYTPPPRDPLAEYHSHSSLTHGADVLTFSEIQQLGCALTAIHQHFAPLIDPMSENRLFAMQIEWKLLKPERRLLVKQARPYTFGTLDVPQDCREF